MDQELAPLALTKYTYLTYYLAAQGWFLVTYTASVSPSVRAKVNE